MVGVQVQAFAVDGSRTYYGVAVMAREVTAVLSVAAARRLAAAINVAEDCSERGVQPDSTSPAVVRAELQDDMTISLRVQHRPFHNNHWESLSISEQPEMALQLQETAAQAELANDGRVAPESPVAIPLLHATVTLADLASQWLVTGAEAGYVLLSEIETGVRRAVQPEWVSSVRPLA